MKRKITVVTGTRAEYGLLYSVMDAIRSHPQLSLSVIATGMHLSCTHGYTIKEIEKDGFKIDATVDMLLGSDSSAAMAKSLGIGLIGITQALEQIKPDVVLVLGDRGEPFAAAVAAAHMNIPVAHIHGGDFTTGSCIDESIRHSITKFSHIHFPATRQSAERIKRLGEDDWRINVTGAPGLDMILNSKLILEEELAREFSLDLTRPLLLVLQHPMTSQPQEAGAQMSMTLEALHTLGLQTILVYPNADPGNYPMTEEIKKFEHYDFLRTFKNLPRIKFISLLNIASALVGNSSSGIIESASFNLPVVNIGNRQEGRERAENVLDVPHDMEQILAGIKKALYDEEFKKQARNCTNPYGTGTAGVRIAEILAEIKIDSGLMVKRITY